MVPKYTENELNCFMKKLAENKENNMIINTKRKKKKFLIMLMFLISLFFEIYPNFTTCLKFKSILFHFLRNILSIKKTGSIFVIQMK